MDKVYVLFEWDEDERTTETVGVYTQLDFAQKASDSLEGSTQEWIKTPNYHAPSGTTWSANSWEIFEYDVNRSPLGLESI